jgi:hypothetical protein
MGGITGATLLAGVVDPGAVDRSGHPTDPVGFDVGALGLPALAILLVVVPTALVLLALGLLVWLLRRGPRAAVVLRGRAAAVLGFGGLCVALAVGMLVTGWPAVHSGTPLLTVPLVGLAAGLGVHLVRRGRGALLVVLAGVAGAGAGELGAQPVVGELLGAILLANLAALAVDARPPTGD